MPTQIGCITGSLARDSINRRLAGRLAELAPPGLEITEIDIRELPLYSYDLDADIPPAARRFKAAITASDGLLLVTPEYNRSIPGALKNALDWGSRPWGDNSWHGKRAAIVGTGLNGAGTAVAQAHLRAILGYLGVAVMGAPETCVPWRDGVLGEPVTRDYLTAFLAAVASHVPRAA
jgi:chromate reductase